MIKKLVLGMVLVSSSAFAWGRLEQHTYGCDPSSGTPGSQAMCAPGDSVTGGGGICPGDPGYNRVSRPVRVNGVSGWRYLCVDPTTHQPVPTISTFACCLHETCTPLDEATCHVAGPEVEGSEQ